MAIRLLSSESIDGALTLTGNLTGTSATFAGTITNVGSITTKASGASNSIVAQWQATNASNCATFRTTDSGYIFRIHAQNSGTIYIQNDDGSNYLKIPDSGSNEVSGNTNFTGNVTIGNSGNINIPTAASGNANLHFDGTDFKITSNSSSANLKLETSSTTRLTINSTGNSTFAGNVGIGGVLPSSNGGSGATLLGVHDTNANGWAVTKYTNATTGTAAADGTIFGVIGNNAYIFNYELGNVILGTNSTNALTIDSSQNSTFAGTVTGTIARFDTLNNNANSANIIYRTGTNTIVGNNASALVVQDGGDVGIGTTSPSNKLEVFAPGNGDGIVIQSDSAGINRAPALHLNPIASSANERNWAIAPFRDTPQSLSFSSSNAKGGNAYAVATTRMIIDGISGNVGINRTGSLV